jgi:small subunit ribosomal protein S13
MAQPRKESVVNFIRIAGTDINERYTLLYGLARIKGVSVMFSNAMCHSLKLDKNLRIKDLSEEQIATLESFLSNPEKEGIPEWMLNQRKDLATGKNLHYNGKDIDFNLMQLKRRLGKLKTYRGLRLRLGLPVRGQRTKANFRRNKTLASMKSKTGGSKK